MDGAVTLGKVTNKIQNCDNGYSRDVDIFHLLCSCIRDDLTTYFSFLPFLSSTGYGEEESEAMNAAEESAAD